MSCDVDMPTVLKLRAAAIAAQIARWQNLVMGDQSNEVSHTCFVPECLVGRKEGGCVHMSKIDNNECQRTSKTNGEKIVIVTAESAIIIHHSSVVPNLGSVPASTSSTQVVIATLATHSQSDGSAKRASHTADQHETGWMCRTMISLIRTPTATECTSSREFALRQKLALRSAYDSVKAVRTKLETTRDTINTSQKRHWQVVPSKWGDFVYLHPTNTSFLKSKGLARKPIYSVIPKVIESDETLGDFGITSQAIQLDSHSQFRLTSHQVCDIITDIFHPSVPYIPGPATSDSIFLSGHMETQLNDTNGSDEVEEVQTRNLTELPILTRVEFETVTIFEDKCIFNFDSLGIHHIAQLLGSSRTQEDDSQPFTTGVLTLASLICSLSPSLSTFFFYLHITFETFISPFLCPFQLLFISPTVVLEHRYLHQPHPLVDCQQSVPIYPMQHLVKNSGRHFITTSILVRFSIILQSTNISESVRAFERDSTNQITIGTFKLLHQPRRRIQPTASLTIVLALSTSRLRQKPSRNALTRAANYKN